MAAPQPASVWVLGLAPVLGVETESSAPPCILSLYPLDESGGSD
jgi:hypothetical protein